MMISIPPRREPVDAESITDEITVSYDAEDRITSIEVLFASQVFKPLVDAIRAGEDIGRALRDAKSA